MERLKLLVLTDHTNHSIENSLYPMAKMLWKHPMCGQIDVVSRGNKSNKEFFEKYRVCGLKGTKVDDAFDFHPDGRSFYTHVHQVLLHEYDAVWLRLPPPLENKFLSFLERKYPGQLFINTPSAIKKAGNKKFLLNFKNLCAPMKKCTTIEDINKFRKRFPIILKPFNEYGGRGILRITNDMVSDGTVNYSYDQFLSHHIGKKIEYLAVKYLKNVTQGDKRIIVIDGMIMGASLRLPGPGSWLCNVSMGGSSTHVNVDKSEEEIVAKINPLLAKMGIFMYGIYTLVNDEGVRILSEINTTSIGGLHQIAKYSNQPVLEIAADAMWNYISNKRIVLNKKKDNDITLMRLSLTKDLII